MKFVHKLRRWPPLRHAYFNLFTARYLRQMISPRLTFSEAGEDQKIAELLTSVNFFIDIGAYDGITGSNTFLFALRGARGLCFEPVRETFTKLNALYRFNPRVTCRHCAISDRAGAVMIKSWGGLSCIGETEDKSHSAQFAAVSHFIRPESIDRMTFAEAAAGLSIPNPVDLLSVDVEGHELNVLRSLPLQRLRFRLIVLETHLRDQSTNELLWQHRDLDEMNSLLQAHGYCPIWNNWANTFYAPRHVEEGEPGAANG